MELSLNLNMTAFDRVRERFLTRSKVTGSQSPSGSPGTGNSSSGGGHTPPLLTRPVLSISSPGTGAHEAGPPPFAISSSSSSSSSSSRDIRGFLRGLGSMGVPLPTLLETLRGYLARDFCFCDADAPTDEQSVQCMLFLKALLHCKKSTASGSGGNAGTTSESEHGSTPFTWPLVEMAEFEAMMTSAASASAAAAGGDSNADTSPSGTDTDSGATSPDRRSGAILQTRSIVVVTGVPRLKGQAAVLVLKDFLGQALFRPLGLTVRKLHFPKAGGGSLRGCVFVTFDTEAEARCGAAALDGFHWPRRGTVTGLINGCLLQAEGEGAEGSGGRTPPAAQVGAGPEFSLWCARPYHHYCRERGSSGGDYTALTYRSLREKGHEQAQAHGRAQSKENSLNSVPATVLQRSPRRSPAEGSSSSGRKAVALEQRRKEGGRKAGAANAPAGAAAAAVGPGLPSPPGPGSIDVPPPSSTATAAAAKGLVPARGERSGQELLQEQEQEQLEACRREISSMRRRLKAAQHRLANYTQELAEAEGGSRALRLRAEQAEAENVQHERRQREQLEQLEQLQLDLDLERERGAHGGADHAQLWRRSVHDWVGLGLGDVSGSATGSSTCLADWEANLEAALLKIRSAQAEVVRVLQQSMAGHGGGGAGAGDNVCCICREVAKSILLLPCRHLCVCEECGDRCYGPSGDRPQQKCPVCRSVVVDRLRVFS